MNIQGRKLKTISCIVISVLFIIIFVKLILYFFKNQNETLTRRFLVIRLIKLCFCVNPSQEDKCWRRKMVDIKKCDRTFCDFDGSVEFDQCLFTATWVNKKVILLLFYMFPHCTWHEMLIDFCTIRKMDGKSFLPKDFQFSKT